MLQIDVLCWNDRWENLISELHPLGAVCCLGCCRGVLSKRLVNVICFLYFSVLIFCAWAVLSLGGSSYRLDLDIFRLHLWWFHRNSFSLFFFFIATEWYRFPNQANFSATLQMINYYMMNIWSITDAAQFLCRAQKCAAHIIGASLCADARCSWGDMVEAILMQCPPLPESHWTSSFPCTVIAAGSGC